jgi:glutaconate CoA-transferase subunit B
LPGAGGAPEIATAARETAIILKHSKRAFVEKLDFITTSGHFATPARTTPPGRSGRGPTTVITDLGILVSDFAAGQLVLTALHPGVTVEQVRAATGWDLKVARALETTPHPTPAELSALRDLYARTAAAHGAPPRSE